MKHRYIPFLAIFLIFVIIGFSIYKQLDNKTEGLETMDPMDEMESQIITRGKRIKKVQPIHLKNLQMVSKKLAMVSKKFRNFSRLSTVI